MVETSQALARSDATEITRDELGTTTAIVQRETSAIATAEKAKAIVQARYIMAIQRPRDLDLARVKLLKECRRPGFAQSARYSLPRGKGKSVEGETIRFAEACMRALGNIDVQTTVTFEDENQRILSVSVTDLESNIALEQAVTVEKTIERSKVYENQEVIGTRQNSEGRMVYIVRTTEADLRGKQGAEVSKAIRTMVLRLVPGDIRDECKDAVRKTLSDDEARDPDAARKGLIDAFAALNITPSDLKEYLGHEVARCTKDEFIHLREIGTAVKEGHVTWREVIAAKNSDTPAPVPEKKTDKLKHAAAEKRAQATAAPAEAKKETINPDTGEVNEDSEPTDEELERERAERAGRNE